MNSAPILPAAELATNNSTLRGDPARLAGDARHAANRDAIRQAAVQFETMFLNEMFSHLFSGVNADNPFGGGKGEEIFQSLMVNEYAAITARSGQTKIAPAIEREMLRMQEEQQNPRGSLAASTGRTPALAE